MFLITWVKVFETENPEIAGGNRMDKNIFHVQKQLKSISTKKFGSTSP
jgi:hypothetical protein